MTPRDTAARIAAQAIAYNLPVDVDQARFRQYASIWGNAAVKALTAAGFLPDDSEDTAQRHLDALADTHEAYTSSKGFHLRCLWCDHFVTGPTEREAVAAIQDHYDRVVGPGKAVIR